jgi:hypothetical protein
VVLIANHVGVHLKARRRPVAEDIRRSLPLLPLRKLPLTNSAQFLRAQLGPVGPALSFRCVTYWNNSSTVANVRRSAWP